MKALIILAFLAFQPVCCQINQRIIDASEKNQEERESRNESSGTYENEDDNNTENEYYYTEEETEYDESNEDSEYYENEYDATECIDITPIHVGIVDGIVEGLTLANSIIKQRDTIINRISSATIEFSIGNITPNSLTMMPRVRFNGALFSMEMRYFSNYERHMDENLAYNTMDWQILMFNLVVQKKANFRFGTGLMIEEISGICFNEHTCKLDIYPIYFLETSLELRLTPDYKTGIVVRRELDVGIGFKLLESEKACLKFQGFYQHANYYEEVNYNVLCFGFAVDFY